MKQLIRRPARHTASRPTIVIGAILTLAIVFVLLAVAARTQISGVPGVDYYKIKAEFSDVDEMRPIGEVRVAGRPSGSVSDVEHDGKKAIVTLRLDPDDRYLPADSTARVRTRNLFALKYLEITPGQSTEELRDGQTIQVAQTSTAVDYGELLDTFDAPARRNLKRTIAGLGGGFLGRGTELNDALARSPKLLARVKRLSDSILARTGAAQRFAPSAETLASAYDPVREELATGFEPSARALAPFTDRRASVQATLHVAPPALDALRRGLGASAPRSTRPRASRATSRSSRSPRRRLCGRRPRSCAKVARRWRARGRSCAPSTARCSPRWRSWTGSTRSSSRPRAC